MSEVHPYLPDGLHGWLKQYAMREDITVTEAIIVILEEKRKKDEITPKALQRRR